MSRQTMIDAAMTLPASPLYGIACCRVGTEHFDFEIGWEEYERDAQWAESVLRSSGVRAGDFILITSPNWENPWTGPLVHGLRRIGAIYMPAEHFDWDARPRVDVPATLARQSLPRARNRDLDGLEAGDPPVSELFSGVEIVWARQSVGPRLTGLSPRVAGFVPLGPALALGIPDRAGVVVNAAEWLVDSEDGELVVSNVRSRAATFERMATGVRGTVRTADGDFVTLDLEDRASERTGRSTRTPLEIKVEQRPGHVLGDVDGNERSSKPSWETYS